jgi:hypothetical protein
VEAFKMTDIWLHLENRASIEIVEALEALKDADAENPAVIRSLQNRAWVAERFLNWLDEAIQNGKAAEEQLQLLDAVD